VASAYYAGHYVILARQGRYDIARSMTAKWSAQQTCLKSIAEVFSPSSSAQVLQLKSSGK
jgi:hypothetical protein